MFRPDEKKIAEKRIKGSIRRVRKATGEGKVFREIWDERERKSEVSKTNLGNIMSVFFMAHILRKSQYPKMRLDKRNIKLMRPDEHHMWDNHKEELVGLERWDKIFALEKELIEEYKLLYPIRAFKR